MQFYFCCIFFCGVWLSQLGEVTRATAVAKLTYACSSWWGYADSAAKARIQAVMNKFKRLGFLLEDVLFVHICQEQDNKLFVQILSNAHHVLHQLLPPIRNIPYSLRPRAHDYELPVANTTLRKNFITRMLYNNTLWYNDDFELWFAIGTFVFCIYRYIVCKSFAFDRWLLKHLLTYLLTYSW